VSRAHNINSSSVQKSKHFFTISHVCQIRRYNKISTTMRPITYLQWATYRKAADVYKNVRNLQCTELTTTLSYIGSSKFPPLYSKRQINMS